MNLVRIIKRRPSPEALFSPGSWDDYPVGSVSQELKSLPVDYTLEGVLQAPIEVGRPICVLRLSRNDVPALGLFISSLVVRTEGGLIWTRNSVYELIEFEEELPL